MPEDFHAMTQQAVERMRELQTKAEPPAPPKNRPAPPLPPAPPPHNARAPQKQSFFSRFLHMENDTALILPLLLLLGREGADDALVLALLYIMM